MNRKQKGGNTKNLNLSTNSGWARRPPTTTPSFPNNPPQRQTDAQVLSPAAGATADVPSNRQINPGSAWARGPPTTSLSSPSSASQPPPSTPAQTPAIPRAVDVSRTSSVRAKQSEATCSGISQGSQSGRVSATPGRSFQASPTMLNNPVSFSRSIVAPTSFKAEISVQFGSIDDSDYAISTSLTLPSRSKDLNLIGTPGATSAGREDAIPACQVPARNITLQETSWDSPSDKRRQRRDTKSHVGKKEPTPVPGPNLKAAIRAPQTHTPHPPQSIKSDQASTPPHSPISNQLMTKGSMYGPLYALGSSAPGNSSMYHKSITPASSPVSPSLKSVTGTPIYTKNLASGPVADPLHSLSPVLAPTPGYRYDPGFPPLPKPPAITPTLSFAPPVGSLLPYLRTQGASHLPLNKRTTGTRASFNPSPPALIGSTSEKVVGLTDIPGRAVPKKEGGSVKRDHQSANSKTQRDAEAMGRAKQDPQKKGRLPKSRKRAKNKDIDDEESEELSKRAAAGENKGKKEKDMVKFEQHAREVEARLPKEEASHKATAAIAANFTTTTDSIYQMSTPLGSKPLHTSAARSATAPPRGATLFSAKAGNPANFQRPSKFGPSGVFSGKERRESGSGTDVNSSSNMFAAVNSSRTTPDAGSVGYRTVKSTRPLSREVSIELSASRRGEMTPQLKKSLLQPRAPPLTSVASSANADEGSPVDLFESRDEDTASTTATAGTSDSEEITSLDQAKRRIKEDVKELFMLGRASEPETYFSKLPPGFRWLLVEELVHRAVNARATDVQLIFDVFDLAASKALVDVEQFSRGFVADLEYLEDTSTDSPNSYRNVASLLKAARLSPAVVDRLADKIIVEGEMAITPKEKLLKAYSVVDPPSRMSREQAERKIKEDIKELFILRQLGEAKSYFSSLPPGFRWLLAEGLVHRAVDARATDVRLISDVFGLAASEALVDEEQFSRGFVADLEYLEDTSIDSPNAYLNVASLLKAARLSSAAIDKLINTILVERDMAVAPKEKLLQKYAALMADPHDQMSQKQARRRIKEDISGLLVSRQASEAETCFSTLPLEFRWQLVEGLACRAVDARATDVQLISDVFNLAASKLLVDEEQFSRGLAATLKDLEDTSTDSLNAYRNVASLLKASNLSSAAINSLAEKIIVKGEMAITPKEKLLKEYASLMVEPLNTYHNVENLLKGENPSATNRSMEEFTVKGEKAIDAVHSSSSDQPNAFTQHLSLLSSHAAGANRVDSHAISTWLELSYEALSQPTRDFLHFISCFHRSGILVAAFVTAATNGFKDVFRLIPRPREHVAIVTDLENLLCTDGMWNEAEVQSWIGTLQSFNLVSVLSKDGDVFIQMDPLVRAWCRNKEPVASRHYLSMAPQVVTSCSGKDAFPLHRHLVPHIVGILDQIKTEDLHLNDLMAAGAILEAQEYHQQAEELFRAALKLMRNTSVQNSRATSLVHRWLGIPSIDEGRQCEPEALQTEYLEAVGLGAMTFSPNLSALAATAYTVLQSACGLHKIALLCIKHLDGGSNMSTIKIKLDSDPSWTRLAYHHTGRYVCWGEHAWDLALEPPTRVSEPKLSVILQEAFHHGALRLPPESSGSDPTQILHFSPNDNVFVYTADNGLLALSAHNSQVTVLNIEHVLTAEEIALINRVRNLEHRCDSRSNAGSGKETQETRSTSQ